MAELYDLAAPRLLRYAVTLTRNRDDAEDILQTAFVQVARCPERLADADHPWPYLLRIVRNAALRLLRKRESQTSVKHRAEVSQRNSFEHQEIAEAVRHAIDQLPPLQAEVVGLKIWENMTFAQIGAVLGVSPNTAASRYQYALEKLTPLLQPEYAEVLHVS